MSAVGQGWTTLSGSRIGSVHVRDKTPLQDAVLTWSDGGDAVVAVADGHGHHDHFRSDVGAALAVVSAVEALRRALRELVTAELAEIRMPTIAATILDSWVAKVDHHLEANPLTSIGSTRAERTRPYGTTLLAAAVTGDLMVFLQIGDGDSVLVSSGGEVFRAVPDDPEGDGTRTSSLCQPEPLRALRTAVVDTRVEEIVLAFLCTDGFGTSRVDSGGWWRQTGEQLVEFGRSRGLDWIDAQLPQWLEEPARIGGDDTTMAILVRADLGSGPQRPGRPIDLHRTVEPPPLSGTVDVPGR